MILVEIKVPAVNGAYEFKLNEDVSVSIIIDEICAVICEKEQCGMPEGANGMILFDSDRGILLSKTLSLYENNIGNGSCLLLL